MNGMKLPLPQVWEVSLYASLVLLVVSFAVFYLSGGVSEQQANMAEHTSLATISDNYYINDVDGPVSVNASQQPVPTAAMSLPAKSVDDILDWSTMVAVQLFTLDFFKADRQIEASKPYFTDDGWKALSGALKGSGWLTSVVQKKLSVTSVLKDSAIVLKHGVLNGAYSWVINFPLLVSYESSSESRVETRVVTLTVRRIDADYGRGQAGIAIDSFVTNEGST